MPAAGDIVFVSDPQTSFCSMIACLRSSKELHWAGASFPIRAALTYIVAVHIPVAGLALLPLQFGVRMFFYPAHVVLLELMIDPICTLVFEGRASKKR